MGVVIPMEPEAVRMSRVRAAEKRARRATARSSSTSGHASANVPGVIPFSPGMAHRSIDPAARARQREVRKAEQEREAFRLRIEFELMAVSKAFISAMHEAEALFSARPDVEMLTSSLCTLEDEVTFDPLFVTTDWRGRTLPRLTRMVRPGRMCGAEAENDPGLSRPSGRIRMRRAGSSS